MTSSRRLLCALLAGAAMACSAPALLPELAEAEHLEREGRHDEAIAAYERAALSCLDITHRERRQARCAEAYLYRAELLDRLGQRREAVAVYLELPAAVDHREAAARATYQAARITLELGDDARAYDLLWRTIVDYPDELAAVDAVTLVADDGRRRAPLQLYRVFRDLWSALEGRGVAPRIIMSMAEIAEHDLDDPRAALALYDELAARYPDSGLHDDALWRGGRLARELGDPEAALARYRRLADTRHSLPFGFGSTRSEHLDDATLESGRILRDDLARYREAIAAFEALPERFPHSRLHDDAAFELALTWGAAGRIGRACAELERLAEAWPDSRYELERAPALREDLGCDESPP